MIKFIAHCPFSGTHSPKPGTVLEAVKLVALQDPKGPNAQHFAEGAGAGTFDLTKVTESVRQQFKAGALYEVTISPVSGDSATGSQ